MRHVGSFVVEVASTSFAKLCLVLRRVKVSPIIEMKKNIHPASHSVCFVDVATGKQFFTKSTVKSKNTETVDGTEYYKVVRDITMDSHPVYTGEKRFVDSAGRVEKFQNKFRRKR